MADEADPPNPEQPRPSVADTAIPDSPGRQLRQAREARKLDIPHVATALRLTPGVVDAIERDDYAPLPSATFVSGYIRGYARLVGLDPERLNQSFRRLHPDAEPPPRHVARGDRQGAPDEGGGSGGFLVLLLIVLAVAAGGYAWWVMRPGLDEQARPAATPEPAAPQPAPPG
ncbi:MAG: helix-turn-helix domain-containing protein, partial [Halochromatium sp.]